MSFAQVRALVSKVRSNVETGLERTKPAERELVRRLLLRFDANQPAPLSPEEDGAVFALWGRNAGEPFMAWLFERGLSQALEVLLAATSYQCVTYEWDNRVWVLRRAQPAQGLASLNLRPFLAFRRAIAAASPKDYAAARAVAQAAQSRAWVLRAALAFLFPKEKAFWSADDDARLRQVNVDEGIEVDLGLLVALRHATLPKVDWWGSLSELTPAFVLKELDTPRAIVALRLLRAFSTLAKLDHPDALRVLGEFADGGDEYLGNEQVKEGAWACIAALKPTPAVMNAFASLFTTHRPRRTQGLLFAKAFLREQLVLNPKVKDAYLTSLLAQTGVGLPRDEQWVSPWKEVAKKPAKAAPVVVAQVPAVSERIHWKRGEREALLADGANDRSRFDDEATRKSVEKDVKNDGYSLMLNVLWTSDAKALKLFEAFTPKQWYGQVDDLQNLLARYELKALPSLLAFVTLKPNTLAALANVESPRVAPVMANAFARLKKPKVVGQAWLERFPQAALAGLLPELNSSDKTRRESAETALSFLRERGLGGQAAALPDVSTRPALPARPPKLPAFISLKQLPRPVRNDGSAALDEAALEELVAALKATLPEKRAFADQIATQYTPQSLAALAASLSRQWLHAGAPPKEKWALYTCGAFADDDAARTFGALARAWAPQGNSARAQEAVEMLAMMRTPTALTEIYELSKKVQSKALKARAEVVFQTEAAKLGLSAEDLADRIIPDLVVPTFGSLTVQFDRHLKARLVDSAGQPAELPKGTDPEELAAWASLKKTAQSIGRNQLKRLELSLGEGRRMSLEHFTEVYVMHPLVRHLSAGLVWGAWQGARLAQSFTVTTMGLINAEGRSVEPIVDAMYGLVHPVELSAVERTAWKKRLGEQPFDQLGRTTVAAKSVEALRTELQRHVGEVQTGALLSLQSRGWRRGEAEHRGCYFELRREGPTWAVRLGFEPGIDLSAPTATQRQTVSAVELTTTGDIPLAVRAELQRDVSGLR